MSDNIRINIPLSDLKKQVKSKLVNKKVALKKDEYLMIALTELYRDIIHDYVPRSDLPNTKPHIQNARIEKDGRLRYTRRNSKGDEIAKFLFYGGRGKWHIRYSGHKPHDEWTDYAMSIKKNREQFNRGAKRILKEEGYIK